MTDTWIDPDTGEDAPVEEMKPKRRRVTPAEVKAAQEAPNFVSPIRTEEKSATEEPQDVLIDDPAALAVMEEAARIFSDDLSPADRARLEAEINAAREPRGRISNSLHAKLVACMAAIKTVEKKGRNSAQSYDYQRAVDVTNEVREEFAAHGVILLTSIDEVRTEMVGQTRAGNPNILAIIQGTFTITDGIDSYTFGGAGMGIDPGDKGIYKAITGMVKYGLRTLLLLSDEKMDPEVERDDERSAPVTTSAPINISPTTVQGVSQGGRQSGATSAQMDAIKRAASDLGLTAGTLDAMIVSVLGVGPVVPQNVDENQYAKAVLDYLAGLSFQDAGKIVKALVEAAQSNGGA